MKTRRLVALVVLAVLATAVVAVGRYATADAPEPTEPLGRLTPTAAPADAPAQTWFCAAGSAEGSGGVAEQTAALTNTTDTLRTATVTALTDAGVAATTTVELPPQSRTPVRSSDLVTATWASLLVEVDGGGVAVDHNLSGPFGATGGPCASASSASWYFPATSTLFGVRSLVALFNPYAERAVLDIVAETDDGVREPGEYAGLVVEPRSVRVVDIAEVITVRDQLSLSITARAGLVVVEQLQVATDDAELPTSLAVTLGAPAPQPAWYFPLGAPVGEGVSQRFVVFNPTDTPAEVDVQLLVSDPDAGFIEPFAVSVRPGQYATVDLADDERVPTGVPLGAYVETRNDVAVVAARVVQSSSDAASALAAGVGGPGRSVSVGVPLVATGWVVPVGATNAGGARLGITNLGLRDAEVEFTLLRDGSVTPFDGSTVAVPAGRRVEVDLGDVDDPATLSVVVRASQPVAVERNVVFGSGFTLAPAVIVGGTASRPQVAVPDTATSPTVVLEGITTTTVAPPAADSTDSADTTAPDATAPDATADPNAPPGAETTVPDDATGGG